MLRLLLAFLTVLLLALSLLTIGSRAGNADMAVAVGAGPDPRKDNQAETCKSVHSERVKSASITERPRCRFCQCSEPATGTVMPSATDHS